MPRSDGRAGRTRGSCSRSRRRTTLRITHVLPKGQFVHTPAFVGCTYSERFVLLELTFISGRPKDKRLALLAALNQLVVEKSRPETGRSRVVLIYEITRREHLLLAKDSRSGAHLGLSGLCARSNFIRLAHRSTVRVGTMEDLMHKAVIMGVGPDRGLGAQLCKALRQGGAASIHQARPRKRVRTTARGYSRLSGCRVARCCRAARSLLPPLNLVVAERSPPVR